MYGPDEGVAKEELQQNRIQKEVETKVGSVILIGDFNGSNFGEIIKNINGKKIIDFCILNELIIGNIGNFRKNIQR